jgi:formylmethanofuran dehydrogenase subunit D
MHKNVEKNKKFNYRSSKLYSPFSYIRNVFVEPLTVACGTPEFHGAV